MTVQFSAIASTITDVDAKFVTMALDPVTWYLLETRACAVIHKSAGAP